MRESVRPIGTQILILPDPEEVKRTTSGLYIPDSAKEIKPARATVLKVGEGRVTPNGELIPNRVQPEDIILYSPYGGNDLVVKDSQGEDVAIKLINDEDIFAVVEIVEDDLAEEQQKDGEGSPDKPGMNASTDEQESPKTDISATVTPPEAVQDGGLTPSTPSPDAGTPQP